MWRFTGSLVLAVALAASTGTSHGQQPAPVYVEAPNAPVYIESAPGSLPSGWCVPNRGWGSNYHAPRPAPTRPVGDWLRRCNACCWSHHNMFSCGSLKSEATFLFGSCRAFYGETCLPRPEAIDHHGWYYRYGGY